MASDLPTGADYWLHCHYRADATAGQIHPTLQRVTVRLGYEVGHAGQSVPVSPAGTGAVTAWNRHYRRGLRPNRARLCLSEAGEGGGSETHRAKRNLGKSNLKKRPFVGPPQTPPALMY